ncbi:MAG: hypothetical protein K8F59_08705 [Rhodobacteraceae bacterium]|nr:hypothetical protein [Paracoccaceae bacterium]
MNIAANNRNLQLLSGNHAVAMGAMLSKPDVAPVYPITPQTPILEKLTELQTEGRFNAEVLTPESEHSVLAACIGASHAGSRVFTATSSQGLLLMHELLHYASGARTSIVMFNVNRTPASPWGFWPDQLDSLSQRDTGWVQLYSETPQESLDSVVQAFKIAETVNLPVMINHDAFYVSHAVEPVDVPEQSLVDQFLPPFVPPFSLDPEVGSSFGAPLAQDNWNKSRRVLDAAQAAVCDQVVEAGRDWGALTGRPYGPIEQYRCEDAEVVIVTMGSMCGTVRDAVDRMRDQGQAVGLLKVRLFRPLPVSALREALRDVPCALVLDRNYSPGTGGILHQEVKAALFGTGNTTKMHGLLAGVGGVSVSSDRIQRLVGEYRDKVPSPDAIWVD